MYLITLTVHIPVALSLSVVPVVIVCIHLYMRMRWQVEKLLCKAKTQDGNCICIKFVHRYGRDVHIWCAEKGFAPNLIAFKVLPGGWHIVRGTSIVVLFWPGLAQKAWLWLGLRGLRLCGYSKLSFGAWLQLGLAWAADFVCKFPMKAGGSGPPIQALKT
jgi:hypothetical protein